MSAIITTKSILWDEYKNKIYLLDDPGILPTYEFTMGNDEIKKTKQLIERDFNLKLQYVRTLPDAWANLLFMHSENNSKFILTIVFKIHATKKLFYPEMLVISDNTNLEELKENYPEIDDDDLTRLELFQDLFDLNQYIEEN